MRRVSTSALSHNPISLKPNNQRIDSSTEREQAICYRHWIVFLSRNWLALAVISSLRSNDIRVLDERSLFHLGRRQLTPGLSWVLSHDL